MDREYIWPEDPPEGYRWSRETVWSCPIHASPPEEYEDEYCAKPCCVCIPCSNGEWIWTGKYELALNLHGLNKMIQLHYLQHIKNQLQSEVLLFQMRSQEGNVEVRS